MRAEAQAYIDRINDALQLLRRFLNWDQALRRLDELNARVVARVRPPRPPRVPPPARNG